MRVIIILFTMSEDQISLLQRTARFIQASYPEKPTVGIVLGSGIGNLSREINIEFQIDYSEIPDFRYPRSLAMAAN